MSGGSELRRTFRTRPRRSRTKRQARQSETQFHSRADFALALHGHGTIAIRRVCHSPLSTTRIAISPSQKWHFKINAEAAWRIGSDDADDSTEIFRRINFTSHATRFAEKISRRDAHR